VPDIPSLAWEGVLWRLALAAVLGGLIGLERELDEKAAGVRTHMLVSVGSALFTIVSAYGFHEFLTEGGAVVRADPSRIAAQIVTGIGFLGAGVILRRGLTVTGLTTAATLWLVAAIGMAAGAGFWSAALIATAGALLSLRPLEWLKTRVMPERRGGLLLVSLDSEAAAAPVLDALERLGNVQALARRGPVLEIEVDLDRGRRSIALTAVSEVDGVDEVRWA
jgi:putative Mg2+ transporter-C (MgtC) family protein